MPAPAAGDERTRMRDPSPPLPAPATVDARARMREPAKRVRGHDTIISVAKLMYTKEGDLMIPC